MSENSLLPETDDGPALRTYAMPSDTNSNGDIFGGWLLSQMDLAGAALAIRRADGRVSTVAVDNMEFHRPVLVGDEVSCYAKIIKTGTTSITVKVETYVRRSRRGKVFKVTEGIFVFVALDDDGKKRPID